MNTPSNRSHLTDRETGDTVRRSLHVRINELSRLPRGWYDGDGETPTPTAIGIAYSLGEAIPGSSSGPDRVRAYPTIEGGISLEWSQGPLSHAITIGPDGILDLMTMDPEEILT